MGMSTEKTKKAFVDCLSLIRGLGYAGPSKRIDPARVIEGAFHHSDYRYDVFGHLVFMCEEGARLIDETEALYTESEENVQDSDEIYERATSRKEKAMRWLGFLQGALWGAGLTSIEAMKHINMPEAEHASDSPSPTR